MAAQQQVHKAEIEEEEEQHQLSLSLCSDSVDVDADNSVNKAARLPRWTRQEILVLIQGKKVAESSVRRGRTSSLEPKWATVSSYCKRHGVNRGAVQCRKRWSNLAGDFKKIKDWDSLHNSDSFWLMRNDLRRERKLPGFFDREVFDILDDKKELVPPPSPSPPPPLLLFDSGRPAPPDDALFSDFSKDAIPFSIPAPAPAPISVSISAKQYEPFTPTPQHTAASAGVFDEKQAGSTSQGERKRKRKQLVVDEEIETEAETETVIEGASASLLKVMEKNGRMLNAQLEAHNMNLKLDREDRKDHANSLVAVLNKLADALARIADKL